MNRAEIIDAVWKETEHTVFISKREFVVGLDTWDLATKEIDGEIVGAILTNGPQFHFITFGTKRSFTRALMVDCIKPILDKYGFVRTMTPKDDARQQRFNLLIGFKVESTNEFFTIFRLEHLNLRGAKTCLS